MSLRLGQRMDEQEAFQMNALQLAYLGDSVWETMVRYELVFRKLNVHHLHVQSVKRVNACAQAEWLLQIIDSLSEREADIVRRGRNSHPKHTPPKNQQPDHYASSTGFEALIGYLYLTGQDDRIRQIFLSINLHEVNQNG